MRKNTEARIMCYQGVSYGLRIRRVQSLKNFRLFAPIGGVEAYSWLNLKTSLFIIQKRVLK